MECIYAAGIDRHVNSKIKWLSEVCNIQRQLCVYSIYTNHKQIENMHHCDHIYNGNHIFTSNFIQIYSTVKGFHSITLKFFLQIS